MNDVELKQYDKMKPEDKKAFKLSVWSYRQAIHDVRKIIHQMLNDTVKSYDEKIKYMEENP